MRSSKVHVLLRVGIEGRTVRENPPVHSMAAFHVRLLPGRHGITVENPGALLSVWCGFEGKRIGKFRAVIRQDDRKKSAEIVMPKPLVEELEAFPNRLRRVAVSEEKQPCNLLETKG